MIFEINAFEINFLFYIMLKIKLFSLEKIHNIIKDLYFTFGSQGNTITNNATYKWKLLITRFLNLNFIKS